MLYNTDIRITGVFLLISGWTIVLAAIALLAAGGTRAGFLAAGVVVEAVGAGLLFRAHLGDRP